MITGTYGIECIMRYFPGRHYTDERNKHFHYPT